MSKRPNHEAWKRTVEKDFNEIQPGDLVEINLSPRIAVRRREDEYGRTWIRFTHDCEETDILHVTPFWVTLSKTGKDDYFLTDEYNDEEDEYIQSFSITPGVGIDELPYFTEMIWKEDLQHIPIDDENSEEGKITAKEVDIVARVIASIQACTLPDDDSFNLLVALELSGCNLTEEQKIKILRLTRFLGAAYEKILDDDGDAPQEPQYRVQ